MNKLTTALEGLRILIVEDDYFIATDLGCRLTDFGAQVVGPIGFIDEAIAFIADHCIDGHCDAFDCAVLDVSLHGQKSYAIADALMARKIPFVFATGYDAEAIDDAYRCYPRCEKPVNESALIAAVLTARRIDASIREGSVSRPSP